MSRPSQTPRSLATQAVGTLALSGMILALSGCSSADLASGNYDQANESGLGGEGEGDGDGGSTDDSAQTETGGEPEAGGDEGDDSTLPEGPEDLGLMLALCDPYAEQVVAYDLDQAQAEVAPVLIRESVLNGSGSLPLIPLSVQPFLNHFEFNYAPAEGWDPEVSGELWKPPAANADSPSRYRLQFAVRGPKLLADQRSPVDLAIVVDLGASMEGEPLDLAEEALAAVEAALMPGDRVTLIAAGEAPQVIASSVVIENFGLTPLTGLLDEQSTTSAAQVAAALALAYETVEQPWDGQGQARVLLLSNGHFQYDDALVELVGDHATSGHYLVSLGLGAPEIFVDEPLRMLAAQGRGPVLYARTGEQLWSHMQTRFAEHMTATATELEITLSLPPGLAIRDLDKLAPSSDEPALALLGPNDRIVFHHELESCGDLAEDAVIGVELEWIDPVANVAKQTVWKQSVAELGSGSKDTLKGAATVAYVRSLRGYRDGRPSNESFGVVLDAISLIAEALEAQPDDMDLIEMSQVLAKLEG